MRLNPEGKVVDQVFLSEDRLVIKEVCNCWGSGRLHWNLLLQDGLREVLIGTFTDEKDIDYVIRRVRRLKR